MAHLIDKDTLVAEIERRIKAIPRGETDKRLKAVYGNEAFVLHDLLSFLDTLEVKEVDLEEEIERVRKTHFINDDFEKATLEGRQITNIAKHFFKLGLNTSNSIAEVNLESLVRQVIDLYLEAGKHYNSVIKEERKEYSGSDLAIKLLDGAIDAKELGIQYVLEKLKAQKEE